MNIVLKEIKEFDEFERLFYKRNGFDDYFWEDILEKEEFYLRKSTIKLAIIDGNNVGLVEFSDSNDFPLMESIEITRLEVQDDFREKGYGRAIVNLLRKSLDESIYLFGFSVSESVEFWRKVASSYDREAYNIVVKEEYNSDFLMHFAI